MMVGCIDDPVVLNREIRGEVTDAHPINDGMLDVVGAETEFQSAWTKLVVQVVHAEIRMFGNRWRDASLVSTHRSRQFM